jgi:hypothetical protein
MAALDAPMDPSCVFRCVFDIACCPSINGSAWQKAGGRWERKRLKERVSSDVWLLGAWRSTEDLDEAQRLMGDTAALGTSAKIARTKLTPSKYACSKGRILKACRHSSHEPDPGGLMEGMKMVTDAIVDAGIAWDDTSKWLEQKIPDWKRCRGGEGFVLVEVWDRG